MTNYFLIHGSFGHVYENWFPWLHSELSGRELGSVVPFLLSPHRQTFDNWSRLLDYYRGLDQIHQDTVIVTHSSGCPFAAKYLVVNEIPVKGLVTVAGFNNYISGIEEFDQINSSFFLSDDDLRRVQHFVDIAHSFYSDNDPFLPLEQLESFSDSIGATPHLIEGGGHLNASAGFREFPELLNTLLTY